MRDVILRTLLTSVLAMLARPGLPQQREPIKEWVLVLYHAPDQLPWILFATRNNAYFGRAQLRVRKPEDCLSEDKLGEEEKLFVIEEIKSGLVRFKASHSGDFLSAEYSTTPPSVVLRKKPDDTSLWRLVRKDNDDQAFLESVNNKGDKAWLAADDSEILIQVGDKDVAEYRRAVLSYKNKGLINFKKRSASK